MAMSSFPRRGRRAESILLSDAAQLLDASLAGDGSFSFTGIAPVDQASESELAPVASRRYISNLPNSQAGGLLLSDSASRELPAEEVRPRIVVADVHQAMATLLEWLYPPEKSEPAIHPTAILGRGVTLGENLRIGPYVVVEGGATIGDGTSLGAHSVIGSGAQLGPGCIIHPHAVVYPGTTLGAGVILHSGSCVGVDGFGYVFRDGEHQKVPQVGPCIIEDDVEIGANTAVDRGSIGDTRVGRGAKVDNLVQLGHNVKVGPLAALASQVGVAGSSRIGTGAVLGGQAGIAGHLTIGDQAQIAAQAGVIGDVPQGETFMGFPARSRREFLRSVAAQGRVPKLIKRVRALEERLAKMEGKNQEEETE